MSDVHIHIHPDAATLAAVENLKEIITMNNTEAVQMLTDVATKIQKIGTESATTLQKVSDLQAVVDSLQAAGQTIDPTLVAAIQAVATQAQVVDDLVPDPA